MNNSQLKLNVKKLLKQHLSFFLILFIPYFIYFYLQYVLDFLALDLEVIYKGLLLTNNASSQAESLLITNNNFSSSSLSMTTTLVFSIITSGLLFVVLDAIRDREDYTQPIKKWGTIFSNGSYFIGAIVILILQTIWTVLWTVLLIVPGIVKSLAYSQAILIYRDAVDSGESIGYIEAISRSRELMDGHKWQYFKLLISFIGWWILVVLTAGLLVIWVGPYYQMAKVNFYNNLVNNN
ncbi:DUF975 family protein [Leuconostoc mesenteroides]|uniref:DUF975 family protein n=1 Tax=Leuconostoc mesenteroides TaxID=1245 RepID=UPI0015F6ACFA|nr:DUF975 family protein [Leuconostoc mesenteroides]MBA5973469.1 DUF975 family protein [Leuconostoc mesenteroides]